MTIKDALFRELKYGLCGSGTLSGIVAQDHVKMDARPYPASDRAESDYPWLVYSVKTSQQQDPVRYATATVELMVIGLRGSATKGDELLEEIRGLLIDHFAGKRVTWGQYTADGTPDPDGGLLATAAYRDTVERLDDQLYEKAYVLLYDFAYLRP